MAVTVTVLTEYWKKYRFAALVLLCGIGLMLLPTEKKTESIPSTEESVSITEENLQQQLESLLGQLSGAGRVRVLLSQETEGETLYQQDIQQSGEGESGSRRNETVTVTSSDRAENGLIRKKNSAHLSRCGGSLSGGRQRIGAAGGCGGCLQRYRPDVRSNNRLKNEMNGGILMKVWKKNLVAVAVLVTVCAGIYINWLYAGEESTQTLTATLDAEKVMSDDLSLGEDMTAIMTGEELNTTAENYFAAVRLSRQQARDNAINLLQEAAAYSDNSKAAESAADLEDIVQTALSEAQIESLIIAKGYEDCVAYMTKDGISVAVSAPEGGLQQQDVAIIADVVMSQSAYKLDTIRVVEVK